MDAVILFEFESGEAGVRADLLARLSPLALAGEGRLSFVGTEPGEQGQPASEILALAFARMETARSTLLRWRSDPAFPASVTARLLRIEPIWSIEPLPLMFP
jgi:hypothetical protein